MIKNPFRFPRIQKTVKKPLKEKENKEIQGYYDIYATIPMEVAIYDLEGRYKFVNQRYSSDWQISEKVIGQNDDFFARLSGIAVESLSKRKQYFQQVLTDQKSVQFTEHLYLPGKNQTRYYKRILQPIFSAQNGGALTGICLFGSSLTSVIQAQKELKYMAFHDKLTGLKNREAFVERLDQMIVESEREKGLNAILLCDIDNFKTVNESLGHKVADFCLMEISQRLGNAIRKSDLIFRVGGDEFAIILKNLNHEYDASRVAEKIIRDLSQPYEILSQHINYLTICIGIVLFPKDGQDRDTLIRHVHSALQNAKNVKRNEFQFFSKELTEKSIKRLEMENHLRLMVNDNSFDKQFEILYQPIVEKRHEADYQIIGCEALLRWHNPDLGDISPDVFIPIAEETDIINPLGDWVLYKAINDFKSVARKFDRPLYISVNFSARQMKSPNIIEKIENIIVNTNIYPQDLHLEITETSLLDEGLQVIENLNHIERLGLKIAIDDFGVGFASLKYLQRFPVSIIKIDRSFIKHINQSYSHKKLVESIILLGKNLEKDIIAEGVESLDHLYVLYTQKCYKYQGFLFSKPVTLQNFESMLHGQTNFSGLQDSLSRVKPPPEPPKPIKN